MLMRRRMMMQQAEGQPEQQWDYTVVKDSSGKCPVKVLSVTTGQTVLVRVYNLNKTSGNVYYASSASVVTPRNTKVSAAWTVGPAQQDYTINVIGDGTLRISSGTSDTDGTAAYNSFYADMYKVRIS